MNRRAFILGALAATAAAVVPWRLPRQQKPPAAGTTGKRLAAWLDEYIKATPAISSGWVAIEVYRIDEDGKMRVHQAFPLAPGQDQARIPSLLPAHPSG